MSIWDRAASWLPWVVIGLGLVLIMVAWVTLKEERVTIATLFVNNLCPYARMPSAEMTNI